MKKILFALFICLSFFTVQADDKEDLTGRFQTSNKKVLKIIKQSEFNEFAYGLLRQAEIKKSPQFSEDISQIWKRIKLDQISQNEKEELLKNIFKKHSSEFNKYLMKIAEEFGFLEYSSVSKVLAKPLIYGLQFLTITSQITASAATPIHRRDTYKDSCINIREEFYSSHDRNIPGSLHLIKADCPYDREAHGLNYNEIILHQDGSECQNIYNNNGTLIVTTDPKPDAWSPYREQIRSKLCPNLTGSFSRTCGRIEGETYKSSDSKISIGLFCKYFVSSCAKKISGVKDNYLYVPKATADCEGKLLENCNGELVVRKKGEDHQCDDNWRSDYRKKEEL